MIRYTDISIGFLVLAFSFAFLGAFFAFPYASYLSASCYVVSLGFYKNISPLTFAVLGVSFLFLTLASLSPYMLAALFPLVGFLFSGENKYHKKLKTVPRYGLLITITGMYLVVMSLNLDSATASHNQLSAILVFAILAELLYFGRPSKWYIVLICISFLFFGNRSALFLLAVFIKNKLMLVLFLIAIIGSVALSLKLVVPPAGLEFLFNEGGILYRSYKETRGDYVDEFLLNFNILDLRYNNWNFTAVPQTGDGFYDLHNSLLTIIVRDSYLGVLKVLLWMVQIFFIPMGVFLGITLRAAHDSFLFGGVGEILLNALIGRSLGEWFKKVRCYMYV